MGKAGFGAVHPLWSSRLHLMQRLMRAIDLRSLGDVALRSARQHDLCADGLRWQVEKAKAPEGKGTRLYWWSLAPLKGLQDIVLLVPGLRTESPQLVSLA